MPRVVKPVRVDCEAVVPLVPPDGWGRLRLFGGGKVKEYNVAPVLDRGTHRGFRVIPDRGDAYAVDTTGPVWTCECGDFEWRRRHRDAAGCKHVVALREYLALLNLLHLYDETLRAPAPDECCFDPREE